MGYGFGGYGPAKGDKKKTGKGPGSGGSKTGPGSGPKKPGSGHGSGKGPINSPWFGPKKKKDK